MRCKNWSAYDKLSDAHAIGVSNGKVTPCIMGYPVCSFSDGGNMSGKISPNTCPRDRSYPGSLLSVSHTWHIEIYTHLLLYKILVLESQDNRLASKSVRECIASRSQQHQQGDYWPSKSPRTDLLNPINPPSLLIKGRIQEYLTIVIPTAAFGHSWISSWHASLYHASKNQPTTLIVNDVHCHITSFQSFLVHHYLFKHSHKHVLRGIHWRISQKCSRWKVFKVNSDLPWQLRPWIMHIVQQPNRIMPKEETINIPSTLLKSNTLPFKRLALKIIPYLLAFLLATLVVVGYQTQPSEYRVYLLRYQW